MKIRIAIQKVKKNKFKHIHNIVIETESKKETIEKIRKALKKEIKETENKLIKKIEKEQGTYYERIIKEIDKDITYTKHKGQDITEEQFIENEMDWRNEGW